MRFGIRLYSVLPLIEKYEHCWRGRQIPSRSATGPGEGVQSAGCQYDENHREPKCEPYVLAQDAARGISPAKELRQTPQIGT